MNNALFTCLIAEHDDEEPFIQTYWSRASHLGEAIQMMLDSAKANGLRNPIPLECTSFDIDDLEGEVEPSADADVFWLTTRHSFPPEPTFHLPVGVIASGGEGGHDVDEIVRGYTMQTNEEGVTYINVNVESEQLFPLYSKLIRLHPEYRVFWYVLHGHWDDEPEDKYFVNEELSSPANILGHLSDNRSNSVQNGFVTLTAYLEDGETNLKIDDHKRIAVSTRSRPVAEEYSRVLEDAGYPKAQDLVSIDCEMHHWHYRVPGSKLKADLERMLKESGFADWNPNEKS